MALLLSEFIEHLSQRSPTLLDGQDLYLNIDDIKQCTDIREIDRPQLVALSLVMLKQLHPYISLF
jgi:hypothetical protein